MERLAEHGVIVRSLSDEGERVGKVLLEGQPADAGVEPADRRPDPAILGPTRHCEPYTNRVCLGIKNTLASSDFYLDVTAPSGLHCFRCIGALCGLMLCQPSNDSLAA